VTNVQNQVAKTHVVQSRSDSWCGGARGLSLDKVRVITDISLFAEMAGCSSSSPSPIMVQGRV
jgi:hypothetical protein